MEPKQGGVDTTRRKSSKRGRYHLQDNAVALLKEWFYEHQATPYPTPEEKQELCRATGLSVTQVCNWFTNTRRRQWAPSVRETLALENKPTPRTITKRTCQLLESETTPIDDTWNFKPLEERRIDRPADRDSECATPPRKRARRDDEPKDSRKRVVTQLPKLEMDPELKEECELLICLYHSADRPS
eukprot:NODE_6326_length_644_cov_83.883946_g6303_i0.p1 GENE.NODE_6326_length_644_cov_83.883946_g6303_i0~~NODE_6326_length_644_cov_83.883946_g6303_i0.p1  ORF type:complete len:199 (-),score=25.40 NODE_6326_length_644_cov_83.883946_g6303_i0:47-604(-)